MKYSKEDIIKWDKEHLWHPYTQMKEYEPPFKNLIIVEGDGNYLIDINGKKYLDAVSSIWCNLFGHSEKRIIEAIKKQSEKICHSTLLGCGNIPAIVFSKKLVDIAPSHLNKVFLSEDGAESVEIAVKMAFEYYKLRDGDNKRNKFISVKEGYHGDTIGAMSVGGSETFHGMFKELLFEGYHSTTPYCYRCKYHNFKDTDERDKHGCSMKCLDDILNLIEKHKDEVFTVILEGGVMGSAGMIPFPDDYIYNVAKVCKDNDIIFILDEVATFCRLGDYFYSNSEKLKRIKKPDIICLGKGITGGYVPLAATLTTDEIYNQFLGDFEECRQLFHGHTYTGNQILCSAGIATLDILKNDRILEKSRKTIDYLHKSVDVLKELEHVGDVRKKGFMIGIELVKNKETKEPYPYGYKAGYKVCDKLLQYGIYMRPIFNTLIVIPPLTITKNEIDYLVECIYKSIIEVLGNE